MAEDILEGLARAVIALDDIGVKEYTKRALEAGATPLAAVEKGLAKGLRELGELFGRGKLFLPELIIGAKVFRAGMEIVQPFLEKGGGEGSRLGKVVMGTVEGDVHDLGISIVGALAMAQGFEVINLGPNILTSKFMEIVQTEKPAILGLSALLTTTIGKQQEVIERLKKLGLRDRVKVIVGGAPVTQAWADKIGADAYGADAADGVAKMRLLVSCGPHRAET